MRICQYKNVNISKTFKEFNKSYYYMLLTKEKKVFAQEKSNQQLFYHKLK